MASNQNATLLVTGASGHLGRRIVELLLETHQGKIIATTRTPDKLADFTQRGVIVRQADFDQPDSLASAFEGAERLLLVSTDKVDVPGQRITQHQNAIKAAQQAGVKHVVYTSIMNPVADSPAFVVPDHRATEEALEASTMGWTVLRENIYTDVLLLSLKQAVQFGTLANAIGDGKAAYITREDCARAAAAALASAFEGRRTLDITGPEAVTQAEVAALLSKLTQRQIAYTPLPLETLIQNMVAAGLPRPVAEGFASFDAAVAKGYFSAVSNTVETLTGQKPTSVADFITANKDSLLS